MKYINSFKLYEKLGVSENLENFADYIIQRFQKEKEFELNIRYNDKPVNILFKYIDKNRKSDTHLNKNNTVAAYVRAIGDPDENGQLHFEFITTTLNKSVIVHELKHIDRKTKLNIQYDKFGTLPHSSRFILNNTNLKIKNSEELYSIFELINPEEFEAYYNQFYIDIRDYFKQENITEYDERKKILDNYFKENEIIQLLSKYKNGDFKLENYFNSNRDLDEFLTSYKKIEKTKDFNIKKSPLYNIIKIINYFKKDIDLSNNNKTVLTKINKMLSTFIQRSYKKVHRLYTHFLTKKIETY